MLACSFRAAKAAYLQGKWPRTVRTRRNGAVLEPAGAFDVTVAPGDNVQEAVDRCPPGGCVLLLPGTHDGPLVLTADKKVHVFGRGHATLRTATGAVVRCEAFEATLDGLLIRRYAGGAHDCECDGVWIKGGRLRMQACDITSAASSVCVLIEGGADPVMTSCRIHDGLNTGIRITGAGTKGRVEGCDIGGCKYANVAVCEDADPLVTSCM